MLKSLIRRRVVLRTPFLALAAYTLSGVFGLTARAQVKKVWRVNASSYASGIERFFALLRSSAAPGGSLPVSSIMWYFPLNPTAPDTLARLAKRGPIGFAADKATARGTYDSMDFQDAAIGALTIILPGELSSKYTATESLVTFEFEGDVNKLAQVVIWNIPGFLSTPKSLRVRALAFRKDATTITLSNTVNTTLLDLELFIQPAGGPKVVMASADPLSATEAFMLLAQHTNYCCNGNCADNRGNIGGENSGVFDTYNIIKKTSAPNAGECSVIKVKKDTGPLGPGFSLVAAGFSSEDAARDAMRTTYKDQCN